uniref:Uncharacterized protein n=1 Tax=Anguilla anguilla TaxID=7936 RepID=A0A0E9RC49_ANGAN
MYLDSNVRITSDHNLSSQIMSVPRSLGVWCVASIDRWVIPLTTSAIFTNTYSAVAINYCLS